VNRERVKRIAAEVERCAYAWEPDVKIIGNVSAADLVELCEGLAALEACAETRQPVAWWIGPHDGLLAGATTNKSLADARIEHGATVRPLVFWDVATEAKAGVSFTDEMVERIARALHEESENPKQGDARILWDDASPYWQDKTRRYARAALTAALTGGANHSTARVTEAEDVSVRTLHDDAMKACDEQRWADAVENEALALGRAVRLNVSARTRHTLAKSLISICTTIEKAALTEAPTDGE
jgi:hypothetical protein